MIGSYLNNSLIKPKKFPLFASSILPNVSRNARPFSPRNNIIDSNLWNISYQYFSQEIISGPINVRMSFFGV